MADAVRRADGMPPLPLADDLAASSQADSYEFPEAKRQVAALLSHMRVMLGVR